MNLSFKTKLYDFTNMCKSNLELRDTDKISPSVLFDFVIKGSEKSGLGRVKCRQ